MIHITDTDKYFLKDQLVYQRCIINYSDIENIELLQKKMEGTLKLD